jgi:hypothetical protein
VRVATAHALRVAPQCCDTTMRTSRSARAAVKLLRERDQSKKRHRDD